MTGTRWTLEELQLLRRAAAEGRDVRSVHLQLPHRTFRALQKKLEAAGLRLGDARLKPPQGPGNPKPAAACAWPLTDGRPWRFCEAPTLPGKSYCELHHAQAVATPAAWKKTNLPNALFRLR